MSTELEYSELIETFINGNLKYFWEGINNYTKWDLVALIKYWVDNYKQSVLKQLPKFHNEIGNLNDLQLREFIKCLKYDRLNNEFIEHHFTTI